MKTNGSWSALHIGRLSVFKIIKLLLFFIACKKGDIENLVKILRNKGNVNIKTEDGFTPLFIG